MSENFSRKEISNLRNWCLRTLAGARVNLKKMVEICPELTDGDLDEVNEALDVLDKKIRENQPCQPERQKFKRIIVS